jgi:hypothetical protein
MWMKDDMNKLRTWQWGEVPDINSFDAGIAGPVRLLMSN